MSKKLISMLLVLLMAVCMLPTSAFAENSYADTVYYKENLSAGEWGGTEARNKKTTSKVYVVPSYAPSSVTYVQTLCYVNGVATFKNVNGRVSLTSGYKYGITNRIYEDGDQTANGVSMWLGVSPAYSAGNVNGVWSPDWTGNGSVTIV